MYITGKEAGIMDWIQTVLIILTVLGAAYYIHRDMKDDRERLHSDMKEEMKSQTARTDRLYEMFIDLLKEKR